MMWYGNGMTGWGWGFVLMALCVIGLCALITVGLIAVVRATNARPSPPASRTPDEAEALLANRFARGEIDEEEYRRRVNALRSQRGGPYG